EAACGPWVVRAAVKTPSARLSEIVAASDEDGLRLIPQNALWRGDMRYADQFGDLITDDWIRATRESAARDARRLREIDRDALDPNDQLVYDVFRFSTELNQKFYEQGLAEMAARMPIDHLVGLHLTYQQIASGDSVAPFKTVKDYEDGLKRLHGFAV